MFSASAQKPKTKNEIYFFENTAHYADGATNRYDFTRLTIRYDPKTEFRECRFFVFFFFSPKLNFLFPNDNTARRYIVGRPSSFCTAPDWGRKKKKKTTIFRRKRSRTTFSRRHGTDARRKLGTDAGKLLARSRGGRRSAVGGGAMPRCVAVVGGPR